MDYLLPVDFVSWRVLEHLLQSPTEREHYNQFYYTAFLWWHQAKTESLREKPFIDLLLDRAKISQYNLAERVRAERLLRWWKMKTATHRTLSVQDEKKALRMIEAAFQRGDDHPNDLERLLTLV